MILINAAASPLLEVASKVLTRTDLPDAALIGGLAVTIRVAALDSRYRTTADVDLVTGDDTPTLSSSPGTTAAKNPSSSTTSRST